MACPKGKKIESVVIPTKRNTYWLIKRLSQYIYSYENIFFFSSKDPDPNDEDDDDKDKKKDKADGNKKHHKNDDGKTN